MLVTQPKVTLPLLLTFSNCFRLCVWASPEKHRWHLQRIVQRNRLSDSQLASGAQSYDLSMIPKEQVNVYVIDSGIRLNHVEFSNDRASYGVNIHNPGSLPTDCAGHGTHVASLVAGGFSGIANNAHVIAVRVLDCDGRGTCSDIMAALEWIVLDIRRRTADLIANKRRSVVVMSIGSRNPDCASTIEVTGLLWDLDVIMTAAAGNNNSNACLLYPARNPKTISVGATDSEDRVYQNNNFGDCVDMFGPGVDIKAAWGGGSANEWRRLSGSSMATPLVAATAALIVGADPSLSSSSVREILVSSSTRNKILTAGGSMIMTNSVNRLLYAPWSRLFDEVAMNSATLSPVLNTSEQTSTFLNQDPSWNTSAAFLSLSLSLLPKTVPAMFYAVIRIRTAIASAAGLRPASILARRAYGVKLSATGEEPRNIRLVFYFPALPEFIELYKARLQNADESGALVEASSESISFALGSLKNALLINVTVPEAHTSAEPGNEGDRGNLPKGETALQGWKIALIVLGAVLVLGLLTAAIVLVAVPSFVNGRARREAVRLARSSTIVSGLQERSAQSAAPQAVPV